MDESDRLLGSEDHGSIPLSNLVNNDKDERALGETIQENSVSSTDEETRNIRKPSVSHSSSTSEGSEASAKSLTPACRSSSNENNENGSSDSLAMEGYVEETQSYYFHKRADYETRDFAECPEQRPTVRTVVYVQEVPQGPTTEESEEMNHLFISKGDNVSIPADIEVFFEEMLHHFRCKETLTQFIVEEILSTFIYCITAERDACHMHTVLHTEACRAAAMHQEVLLEAPVLCIEPQRMRQVEEVVKATAVIPSGEAPDTEDGSYKALVDIAFAIYRDDVECLKEVIKVKGLELTEAYGRILEAVESNSLKCLDYLCEFYEDKVECKSEMTLSKLGIHLCHRRFGLNWPSTDRPLESPLHLIASRCSALEAMKVVEKHSNFMKHFMDEPDNEESTPLLIAIKRNNVEVAKRLLNHSAKKPALKKKNVYCETPICLAARNGQATIMEEILKEYSSLEEYHDSLYFDDELYGKDHTILYLAAQSGSADILNVLMKGQVLKTLLEKEKEHKEWQTFVCNVFGTGCEELVKEILRLDTKIEECVDVSGATPLMRAAEADKLDTVRILLDTENGRKMMFVCDNQGRNVFHFAVKHSEILEYVLTHYTFGKAKKAITQKNAEGNSPLQLAAKGELIESFKLLLTRVDNIVDDLFLTPFVGYTNLEILQLAIEEWESRDADAVQEFLHGEKQYQPFVHAASRGNIEMMKFLLQQGANEEQRGFNDCTALHCAVSAEKLPVVEFLIEKFPDMIDYTDDCGKTAACRATELGNVEILKYLLNNGAQMKGDETRINILDTAFGYFKKAEGTIKEIIKFCREDTNPNRLKELIENSHFGPDRLMSKLIQDIPSAAMDIFDQCVYGVTSLKNSSYAELVEERKVTYHFFPFKPKPAEKSNGKLAAIETMVTYKRDECLGHRVVLMFMNKKLSSPRVALFFLLNTLFYISFLMSLTTYVGLQTEGSYSLNSSGLTALSVITVIFCIISIIKEIIQAGIDFTQYIHNANNLVEWLMYICAILYVVQTGEEKTTFQIATGAIAVFLAWINLLWFLKMSSFFGIYIIMAMKVFTSVCKVLPMVTLFIIAFAMAFSMLTQDEGFTTFPISFLTTFVMMTGEVDFRDTFLGSGTSVFTVLQKVFLVVFLLLITIAIMNLFTGLAVDDTAEIMKRAKQERRLYKANLVLSLERTIHKFSSLFPPFDDETWEEKPANKMKGFSLLMRIFEQTYILSDEVEEEGEVELKDVQQQLGDVNAMIENKNRDLEDSLLELKEQIINEVNGTKDTITENQHNFSTGLCNALNGFSNDICNTWDEKEKSIHEHLEYILNHICDTWDEKEKSIQEQLEHISELGELREKTIEKRLTKIQNMLDLVEANVESVLSQTKYSRK